jgi:hypothetical protein
VKDLSRLGRNAIDSGYYIEKYLPSIGCRFIAVTDDFDSIADMNNGAGVILPLKMIVHEAYSIDVSRKIKAQQQQAMKSGEYVGSRPPYGYLKAEDNCHKLIIDPETAPVVKQVFEWFLDGVSVNHIVRRLNERRIVTPSFYRKSMGIITHDNLIGNGYWQTFTITRMLENDVYVGDMVQGKSKSACRRQTKVDESEWIRVLNTHEPIISREVFEAVQKIRTQVSTDTKARQKTPYTQNIFKGKVFCGVCGGALHRQRSSRAKSDDIYIFHCLSNSRKARGSCIPYSLPEKELLATLLSTIQQHAEVVTGNSVKLRKASASVEADRDLLKARISALRLESDKDGRMLQSLFESLATGLITADEYRDMRADYSARQQEALQQAAELERRQRELDKQ